MSERPAPALVWCPFGDEDSARAAAGILLDEGLVACANILPGIESLFVWNGAAGQAREVGMLLKTNAALLEKVIARLDALHPYDQPTILGWRCEAASAPTAGWLGSLGRQGP